MTTVSKSKNIPRHEVLAWIGMETRTPNQLADAFGLTYHQALLNMNRLCRMGLITPVPIIRSGRTRGECPYRRTDRNDVSSPADKRRLKVRRICAQALRLAVRLTTAQIAGAFRCSGGDVELVLHELHEELLVYYDPPYWSLWREVEQ